MAGISIKYFHRICNPPLSSAQVNAANTYIGHQLELERAITLAYAEGEADVSTAATGLLTWYAVDGIGYLAIDAMLGFGDVDDNEDELAVLEDALDSAFNDLRNTPKGFEYLWYLGQSTVFEAYEGPLRKGVRATPSNDAGIIRKAVDIPLNEDTLVSFDWLYQQLPAKGPETEAQFHDYLSIAIEFDNGQDVTWFWSGHLEAGTEFTCPLPWWDQRETHFAVQSGEAGLGEWHSHTREVLKDYQSAVGGPLPGRILGVWVINSGVFGDKPGEAIFASINVINGNEVTTVFDSE